MSKDAKWIPEPKIGGPNSPKSWTTKGPKAPLESKTTCKHPNLVPLELKFGKVTYTDPPNNSFKKVVIWDEWNIVACHRARVVKYYCPDCKAVINISTKYEGE